MSCSVHASAKPYACGNQGARCYRTQQREMGALNIFNSGRGTGMPPSITPSPVYEKGTVPMAAAPMIAAPLVAPPMRYVASATSRINAGSDEFYRVRGSCGRADLKNR
eukprot:4314583-Pleurochrysis_carterae.AAC.2